MRAAGRLLATVKPGRVLEPYQPTGLTGLTTHPTPRSTLLFIYNSTLNKLQKFPETSVYRKSTEALTKRRLEIVEAEKPAGYDEWVQRAEAYFEKNPQVAEGIRKGEGIYKISQEHGSAFINSADQGDEVAASEAEDGVVLEGSWSEEEKAKADHFAETYKGGRGDTIDILESEPQLDADQIATIEKNIGAGLIEEVIQVAEGELQLAGTMAESQVWEDLEEKPVEGQWTYFEREGTKEAK